MSEDVNIGHCLIGDSKSMEFVIENNGGKGRFCFVSGDSYDWKQTIDIAWDEVIWLKLKKCISNQFKKRLI